MTADIFHWFAQDIETAASGDLRPVTGVDKGRQRILRRLLTPPGAYIMHPEYGAGLPQRIGDVPNVSELKAIIREQMLLEEAVARDPEPEIFIQPIRGGIAATIRYLDAPERIPVVLGFDVTR